MTNNPLYIDPLILTRVSEGDEQAFSQLFYLMIPVLKPGILKLVESEDVFKEIIQECFLKVWINRDQLPAIEKPVHWIYRIASNECFTWLNKRALTQKKLKELGPGQQTINNADHSIIEKETTLLIREAIMAMPEQKQRIYLLSRREGLKTSEIASLLNLSHSHVRNSISAALSFIRDHLAKSLPLIALIKIYREL